MLCLLTFFYKNLIVYIKIFLTGSKFYAEENFIQMSNMQHLGVLINDASSPKDK